MHRHLSLAISLTWALREICRYCNHKYYCCIEKSMLCSNYASHNLPTTAYDCTLCIFSTIKPVMSNPVTYRPQLSDLIRQVAALERSLCKQTSHLEIVELVGLNIYFALLHSDCRFRQVYHIYDLIYTSSVCSLNYIMMYVYPEP